MKKVIIILTILSIIIVIASASFNANAASTCYIDGGANKQAIDGIGFSSAWCGKLSEAKNNALYNTLGMSLLRIRIDPNKAWSDETANSSAAHSRGAKVMGTAWTPPASMKDNNNTVGGNLSTNQYSNYANFLKSAASTINLDWVSFQNEPDIKVTYESCDWTPEQMKNFCANNVTQIGKPIIMPESFHFDDKYADATLNDSNAVKNVSIVGGHIYGAGLNTHQNAINKGKKVWQTEHYINGTNDISACMNIAKEVSDCLNNQMSAYFWWWVNDSDNNINLVNSSGNINKNGYTIGQFAKWVRPGMTRIGSTYSPNSNVYVTAYKGESGVTIVAINTGGSSVSQPFTLQNISGVSAFNVNCTSANQNMANLGTTTVSNNSFTYTLPAQSITTFHYDGKSSGGETNTPVPTTTATQTIVPTPVETTAPVTTTVIPTTVTPKTTVTPISTVTPTKPYTDMSAKYLISNDWGSGAGVDITITNNSSSVINNWTISWMFPGNQKIVNVWSAKYTQNNTSVSISNESWNGTIPVSGSVSFGFNINYSGTNAKPTICTLNGSECDFK